MSYKGLRTHGAGLLRILATPLFLVAALGTANAQFTQSSFITFTLEGCRNDGTIKLPISGQFICPDAAYTTGNLGKGWNELDLVPHRLTAVAGGQAGTTTTYDVYVAADYQTSGNLGYDVISFPAVNTAKSDPSCTVSASAQSTSGSAGNAFGGGTDIVIYRQLTINQNPGATCVLDYYERLALGSHLYPGASLQSYMFDQAGLSGSKKTISIPVTNGILPQSLTKDMSATQGQSYPWTISKTASSNTLSFGDVCATNPTMNLPVTLTVTWTKGSPDVFGNIQVTTHVYATNPASRTITTVVTDKIQSGTTVLDTIGPVSVDVPAATTLLVLTHSTSVDSGTASLNDIATATYTDSVTGVTVPGNTQATASASVQLTTAINASATIGDVESMSGTGLKFSVPAPSFGSFVQDPTAQQAYTAGSQTVGPVDWLSNSQTGGNSIQFNKTVYLDAARITSGVLSDSAALQGADGFTASATPVTVNISSTASPRLTISKTIPPGLFSSGTVVAYFTVTRLADSTYSNSTTITFSAGGATSLSTVVTGPTADQYSVKETKTLYFPTGCGDENCAKPAALSPSGGDTVTVDLRPNPTTGVVPCTGTASFTNSIPDTVFPKVQVKKSTLPNTDTSAWKFTLNGPSLDGTSVNATANSGNYVSFGSLLAPGKYTVTETTKTPWYLYSAQPNDTTHPTICTFTVVYPTDFIAGKTFNCDFVNSQQYAKVVKTVQGAPPPLNQSFTFQIRQGATTTQDGTTLETQVANSINGGVIPFSSLLVPGQQYQVCEIVMPGWSTTLGNFVPNSFIPPDGIALNPAVDNSSLCGNFSVNAGETKTFTVDNTPPPGGRALTIGFWKNWASCNSSGGKQAPVLDQKLAVFGSTGEVISATSGTYALFGATYYLQLFGSTSNPNVAPSCQAAVNLLNKSTVKNGTKSASDPAFNLAAQLVAAELNYAAGSGKTPTATTAINQAVLLLGKYHFDGNTHTNISAADATTMNNLATTLNNYNNDIP